MPGSCPLYRQGVLANSPGDLYALAQQFLTLCEDALDLIPISVPGLSGSPARSFVSPGQSADDCCPQLTVWAGPLTDSLNLGRFNKPLDKSGASINLVQLQARIIRCVPAGQQVGEGYLPPDPTEEESAAAQVDADGWVLWNHAHNAWRNGTFLNTCKEVYFDACTPITPSGGCGGWVLTIRASLDGFQETPSS